MKGIASIVLDDIKIGMATDNGNLSADRICQKGPGGVIGPQ